MIANYAGRLHRSQLVQWDEPISPDEQASILAELAKSAGVDVYWMGRSYLGENLWAADVTLPTPSQLRSAAKETTLKATIVYSGRQHANEVSSTSHILKLGEQLVNDAQTRAMLKQVNVVCIPSPTRMAPNFRCSLPNHSQQHAASRLSRRARRGMFPAARRI